MNERAGSLMRMAGKFEAALATVEAIQPDHDDKHLRDLREVASTALRKAMLLAWQMADESTPRAE